MHPTQICQHDLYRNLKFSLATIISDKVIKTNHKVLKLRKLPPSQPQYLKYSARQKLIKTA